MTDEDDREMRSKSEDNERFAGNKKTPGALHSKEANTRMGSGDASRHGSGSMGDADVTLEGLAPDLPGYRTSKDALPDGAANDVDDLADQLVDGVDPDVAERYARMILRSGDTLSMLKDNIEELEAEIERLSETIVDEDGKTRFNDRIGTAD